MSKAMIITMLLQRMKGLISPTTSVDTSTVLIKVKKVKRVLKSPQIAILDHKTWKTVRMKTKDKQMLMKTMKLVKTPKKSLQSNVKTTSLKQVTAMLMIKMIHHKKNKMKTKIRKSTKTDLKFSQNFHLLMMILKLSRR